MEALKSLEVIDVPVEIKNEDIQTYIDDMHKMTIALKEANETGYWLELLYKTGFLTEEEYKAFDSACASIRVMLISSVNTAKQNQRNEP